MTATHIQIPLEKFRDIFNQLFNQHTASLLQELVGASKEVTLTEDEVNTGKTIDNIFLYQ